MKKLKKGILSLVLVVGFMGFAQKSHTVKGQIAQAKNAELELIGFNAIRDTLFAKTKSDSLGNFILSYPVAYKGAGLLKINISSKPEPVSLIVLLNKENFTISWDNLEDFNTLRFENSPENDALSNGMKVYQESEGILAGLKYLKPLYEKSPKELQWLDKEIARQETATVNYTKKLPTSSYAGYYLGIRKLIADMPATASRYIERLPETEKQFKAIDFQDEKLLQSGLLGTLLNDYYQLMESHGDLDAVTAHANEATEAMLKSLDGNPVLKQDVAAYLFKLLEKRSLFKAAEHLALLMLNDNSCTLDKMSTGLYEQYREMAVGKQAPAIALSSGKDGINSLSDIKATYKLVVFGSSWCPKCQEEMEKIKSLYQGFKETYNLEVVFISLDTEKEKYEAFVKEFPGIASCDLKGWETQSAIDYHVFATPTMYLLDKENKILLKPFSSGQVDAWLIGNGNKLP